MDPPRTAEYNQTPTDTWASHRGSWSVLSSELSRVLTANLLQRRSAQLDGDVGEQAVPLRAEVSDDVRVCVRLPEKLHLPLCYLETLGQDSLDGDTAPIKFTSKVKKRKRGWKQPWTLKLFSVRVKGMYKMIRIPENKRSSCSVSKHLRGSEGDFSYENFFNVVCCKKLKINKTISDFFSPSSF